MIYNIALVFDKGTNGQIHDFYSGIKGKLNLEFGLKEDSIPHATIAKFESYRELDRGELDDILKDVLLDLKLDFSGITFLPSHSEGCWVEMPILKSWKLVGAQREIVSRLDEFRILSGVGDRFRPHMTFCKIRDSRIDLDCLDYSVIRKKNVESRAVIGLADSGFEFYKL